MRKLFLFIVSFGLLLKCDIAAADNIKKVAVSKDWGNYSCAIDGAGLLYCWGTIPDTYPNYIPAYASPHKIDETGLLGGKNVIDVSLGSDHACAINSVGEVYCWGRNINGENGFNSKFAALPQKVGLLGGKPAKAISSGIYCNYAISNDGRLYHWGVNTTINGQKTFTTTPTIFHGTGLIDNKTVKKVSVYAHHVCAITSDDMLYCWGANGYGQLGINTTTDTTTPTSVGGNISDVSVGDDYTCLTDLDGALYCWGHNSYERLGLQFEDYTYYVPVPQPVGIDGITSISTGTYQTCVAGTEGAHLCWGWNSYGIGGENLNTEFVSAYDIKTKTIAADGRHACAITLDNKLYCWGNNEENQVGAGGSFALSAAPKLLFNPADEEKAVDVGVGFLGSCATTEAGKLYCWGEKHGISPAPFMTGKPLGKNAAKLAMNKSFGAKEGKNHYVFTTDGLVYGWDAFEPKEFRPYGGTGDVKNSKIKSIARGTDHTCLSSASGMLYCVGNGKIGQLGVGEFLTEDLTPLQTINEQPLIYKTETVSSTSNTSCAINNVGDLYCWGHPCFPENGGACIQGPTGTVGNYMVSPNKVNLGNQKAKAVTVCESAIFAITTSGEILSWDFTSSPAVSLGFLDGKAAVDIQSDDYSVCAINSAGQLYCWGSNNFAELGTGNYTSSNTPQKVFNTATGRNDGFIDGLAVKKVSIAHRHTCAINASGKVYCWGSNDHSSQGLPLYVYTPAYINTCSTPCCRDSNYSKIGKTCPNGTYICRSNAPDGTVGCALNTENCSNGVDDDLDGLTDGNDPDCKQNPDPVNPVDPVNPINPVDPNNPTVISFKNPTPPTVTVNNKNATITLGPKATLDDWLKDIDTSKLKPAKKKKLKYVYKTKLTFLGKKTSFFTGKKNVVTRKKLKPGKYKVSYQVLIKLGKKIFKKSKFSKAVPFTIAGKKPFRILPLINTNGA